MFGVAHCLWFLLSFMLFEWKPLVALSQNCVISSYFKVALKQLSVLTTEYILHNFLCIKRVLKLTECLLI